MININIKVPYYSAGKKYGWEGNSIGIGVPAKRLREKNETLQVKLKSDGKVYEIPIMKARELVLKYNSFFLAKKTRLAVIPMQEFEIVGEYNKSVASKTELDALQHEVFELVEFYTNFDYMGSKEWFLIEYDFVFKKYKKLYERNRSKN